LSTTPLSVCPEGEMKEQLYPCPAQRQELFALQHSKRLQQ
jgi:hypothetical protein